MDFQVRLPPRWRHYAHDAELCAGRGSERSLGFALDALFESTAPLF